ncbi:hypothetical protein [Xenorhabdus bovienii]|nr:hypothetical protein [Xenorhabdus bovienii]
MNHFSTRICLNGSVLAGKSHHGTVEKETTVAIGQKSALLRAI